MYAAKRANTHHCRADAALRQESPPPTSGGGGARCTAGDASDVTSGCWAVAETKALYSVPGDRLSGIRDESPHHGDPGATGPHDERYHNPVSRCAPKPARRHEDLPGPVIPAPRRDPAARAVAREGVVWGQNRGKVGDRTRRRCTDLICTTLVTGDVELPEPKYAKREHHGGHNRKAPHPSRLQRSPQHRLRLMHPGFFRIQLWAHA